MFSSSIHVLRQMNGYLIGAERMIKNIAIVSLSRGTIGECLNIDHAQPRCIIPFGVMATVDAAEQVIRFAEGI